MKMEADNNLRTSDHISGNY